MSTKLCRGTGSLIWPASNLYIMYKLLYTLTDISNCFEEQISAHLPNLTPPMPSIPNHPFTFLPLAKKLWMEKISSLGCGKPFEVLLWHAVNKYTTWTLFRRQSKYNQGFEFDWKALQLARSKSSVDDDDDFVEVTHSLV